MLAGRKGWLMTALVGVAIGGATGSVLGWWIGLIVPRFLASGFPWTTPLINFAGNIPVSAALCPAGMVLGYHLEAKGWRVW